MTVGRSGRNGPQHQHPVRFPTVRDNRVVAITFHALRGHASTRYTVHVNGPWCITFEFRDGDPYVLDFEQYH